MPSSDNDGQTPMIWCPLLPPEELRRFTDYSEELSQINSAYDDWRTKMRGLLSEEAGAGMLLDRVRMLMISIGIAVPRNRSLVETVQDIVSDKLRKRAIEMVATKVSEDRKGQWTGETLVSFFKRLRFTRDIIPREEMVLAAEETDAPSKKKRGVFAGLRNSIMGKNEEAGRKPNSSVLVKAAMPKATEILRHLYRLLLSVDPWGESN